MNKSELIDEIQRIKGEDCSKACAERSLDAVLQAIVNGITKTRSVQFIGFGTFSVSTRASRMGVNPKTKEKIRILASKSIKFELEQNLKMLQSKICAFLFSTDCQNCADRLFLWMYFEDFELGYVVS
jgi:nucleoid DNA-binding protein